MVDPDLQSECLRQSQKGQDAALAFLKVYKTGFCDEAKSNKHNSGTRNDG
jgi:hypothetical protein